MDWVSNVAPTTSAFIYILRRVGHRSGSMRVAVGPQTKHPITILALHPLAETNALPFVSLDFDKATGFGAGRTIKYNIKIFCGHGGPILFQAVKV
jgi:hypothetical protein